MDMMAEEDRLPIDVEAQPVVQAAAALKPALREYHEEIEREQRMPPALFRQLREAGFYKMVIPRSLGGLQVDPLTYLRVVETLAEGVGSVGWNLTKEQVASLDKASETPLIYPYWHQRQFTERNPIPV